MVHLSSIYTTKIKYHVEKYVVVCLTSEALYYQYSQSYLMLPSNNVKASPVWEFHLYLFLTTWDKFKNFNFLEDIW